MTVGFAKVSIKGEGILSVVLSCSPVPPCRPVVSRLRGNDGVVVVLDLFTLTFDSSSIKGEGDWWVFCCMPGTAPVDTALKPV